MDTAQKFSKEILEQAEKDSDHLIIEMNNKFHKSAETKKKLAEKKIIQMKENDIKEIRDTTVKIAIEYVKKIVSTSIDKTKLDALFEKNLEETKKELWSEAEKFTAVAKEIALQVNSQENKEERDKILSLAKEAARNAGLQGAIAAGWEKGWNEGIANRP